MIAAILFCISIVAFTQFGFYYWRAMISSVAAQAVSDRLRATAGIVTPSVGSHDFRAIVRVRALIPGQGGAGARGSFGLIQAYYVTVEKLGRLIPSIAGWSEAEMTTCSRYVAVLVDQSIERYLACASQQQ